MLKNLFGGNPHNSDPAAVLIAEIIDRINELNTVNQLYETISMGVFITGSPSEPLRKFYNQLGRSTDERITAICFIASEVRSGNDAILIERVNAFLNVENAPAANGSAPAPAPA